MSQRTLIICAGFVAAITDGCVTYQHKTVYKDSDIKVIYHQPLSFKLDALPRSYTKIIVAGRSYKLADCIDFGHVGFLKIPDDRAVVFIADNGEASQATMMMGTLHVVNLKTKLDTAVPLGIHWIGFNPKMFVTSFDGHRLSLFVDSEDGVDDSGDLEIDLDAKQVAKFDRTNNLVPKPVLTP